MRIRTFLLLLGVPLLLMGALIVGLQIGEDELGRSVAPTPTEPDVDQGGSDGGASAARGVRLQRIGTFRDPVYVTAPPGDRRRVFVVEQSGRIMLLLGGKRVGRPFLDLSAEVTAGGEQGLLSMAFAPGLRGQRALLRLLHRPRGRPAGAGVQALEREPEPRRQVDAAAGAVDGGPIPEPQRRPAAVRAGRPAVHRNGRRRLRRGPGEPRAEPRLAARQDPAHRSAPSRLERLPLTRLQPVRGPRRARRDLRVRAAQPLALLVRRPQRQHLHRRRGAGPVRGDRLRPARGGPWSQLRLELLRGPAALRRLTQLCPGRRRRSSQYGRSGGECSVTGGVVVRDPQLPALAGRYVYGDYCVGRIRSFRERGGRATGDRALQPARRTAQLVR